jgi:anti-sigma factor RsiW
VRCDEARAILWPPEDPRLASPEVLEAREHVDHCDECAEYFAQSRELLDFYQRARSTPAPPAVRERVFDALARERLTAIESRGTERRSPASRIPLMAAAVVALLAVASAFYFLGPRSGETPQSVASAPSGTGAAFVEDFLRRAVQEQHIRTSDPAEVRRFLQRELGLPIQVLNVNSFLLDGAEVCIVEGIRGAVVLYKRNGEVLYHYVIPGDRQAPSRAPRLASNVPAIDGIVPLTSPSVVTWAEGGMEQALVSELPSDDLMALVREIVSLE